MATDPLAEVLERLVAALEQVARRRVGPEDDVVERMTALAIVTALVPPLEMKHLALILVHFENPDATDRQVAQILQRDWGLPGTTAFVRQLDYEIDQAGMRVGLG